MKDREMNEEMEKDIVRMAGLDVYDKAKYLYEQGYRKLSKDSVVLSKEEYKKLKYTWITDSDAYKKGCKEMAEKILNETMHIPVIEGEFVKVDELIDKLKEIATREGVEIME